jgi:hypothetical protein
MPAAKTKEPKSLSPLWINSIFVGLTETIAGLALTKATGSAELILIVFIVVFPTGVATAFFIVLWAKAQVFYPPGAFTKIDPQNYAAAMASRIQTSITKTADLKQDSKVVGNPDHFQLLFKAKWEGWMKSTKAMEVGDGCLVQVTSEHINVDGSVDLAEALTYVPNVGVEKDDTGTGRRLYKKTDV